MDYETLLVDVDAVPAFAVLIDPDDSCFLAPQDMPATINTYLIEHGQAPLLAPSAFARCIMESLVLRYCQVFEQMRVLTGRSLSEVHVLGGGARNNRLNQWLSDALAVPVLAGPYEATALGNALMQLVGLGELSGLEQVRAIARNSQVQTFLPRKERYSAWQEAAARYRAITDASARETT